MALHYAHRFGVDEYPHNKTLSGRWLLKAAELGDSNAQILAAKALRGEYDPLLSDVDCGPRNTTLAVALVRVAARGGRASAAFMAADHELQQGKCDVAYQEFAGLNAAKHPMTFMLYAHAHRAFQLADSEGAALRLLLLSEAGCILHGIL